MGTRPADKLKEIEQVRSQLDAKVAELERRMPMIADTGRRVAAIALGGGAGGGVLWFLLRKRRSRKKDKKDSHERKEGFAAPTVVVHGLPKGLLPIAVASIAVWAAVRIYEARRQQQNQSGDRAAVVSPMPERQAL